MRRSGWGKSSRFARAGLSLYGSEVNKQSPIVSEFATEEEAAAYEAWLRRKVAASLAGPGPAVPHDEVMAGVQSIIDKAKARPAE